MKQKNARRAMVSSRRSFRVESKERDVHTKVKKGQVYSDDDSRVGVSIGVTIGLPGYSSVRVDTSLSHPVGKSLNKAEIKRTFTSVLEEVLTELEEQIKEVLESKGLKKIQEVAEVR